MFDLVTVVFKDELPILKVQAQSISTYCQKLSVRNIYVVVNDNPALAERIDPAWWYQHRANVKILHHDVFGADLGTNGWVSQQILKLLAAAMSNHDWSLVLDAKTVFVKPVTDSLLLSTDNCARTGTLPVFPVFAKSQEIIEQLFDITMTQQIGPGGVPFLLKNQLVREMISEIEKTTNKNFCKWFVEQGCVTEFMLYAGYVIKKFGTLSAMYTEQNPEFSVHNICHGDVNQFDAMMNRAELHAPLTVSVHRHAWSQLTDQQQQRYRDYLRDHSLGKGTTL